MLISFPSIHFINLHPHLTTNETTYDAQLYERLNTVLELLPGASNPSTNNVKDADLRDCSAKSKMIQRRSTVPTKMRNVSII
jgi:hypothetical protein